MTPFQFYKDIVFGYHALSAITSRSDVIYEDIFVSTPNYHALVYITAVEAGSVGKVKVSLKNTQKPHRKVTYHTEGYASGPTTNLPGFVFLEPGDTLSCEVYVEAGNANYSIYFKMFRCFNFPLK